MIAEYENKKNINMVLLSTTGAVVVTFVVIWTNKNGRQSQKTFTNYDDAKETKKRLAQRPKLSNVRWFIILASWLIVFLTCK